MIFNKEVRNVEVSVTAQSIVSKAYRKEMPGCNRESDIAEIISTYQKLSQV